MSNSRIGQLSVPLAVLSIITMMIVPLPAAFLDILIVVNITGALAILMTTMYVRRPLEFATFPALLLVMTLFRLALNISVTRRILSDGYAGSVVDAFGHFVIGGSIVVGLVVFLILIVIQFIVVTKGAERVAEVGARFTLDAMPGKQMAIDADLNAGLIDETVARTRRADVAAEADFYGAMDGGSKFVKGDAIAAIIIVVINLVGGMAVGVAQRGLSFGDAISQYSLLTVGDGLVSQIPALMLSVATGLIVTRATTDGTMGSDVMRQLSSQRRALEVAGAGVMCLALVPSLPKVPFIIVGGGLLLVARRLTPVVESVDVSQPQNRADDLVDPAENADSPESLLTEMRVDPIELEVSIDVVDLVDARAGGDLLTRVKALRRKIALELGVVMPPVRTRDDLELPASTYRIRVHGVEVGRGTAPPGMVLAIGDLVHVLPGEPTREPVFGLEARWITEDLQHQAEMTGATVVDRASVITTHLAEIVRQNAASLLSREDVRTLVEAMRRSNPTSVEELTPAIVTLGEIQRVLQLLLQERVPIRDLVRIFEAMSMKGRGARPEAMAEAARGALGSAICASLAPDGLLDLLTLDPVLEQDLLTSLHADETGVVLVIDPTVANAIGQQLHREIARLEGEGRSASLVVSAPLRAPMRNLICAELPHLAVVAYTELGGPVEIRTRGVVSLAHASTA